MSSSLLSGRNNYRTDPGDASMTVPESSGMGERNIPKARGDAENRPRGRGNPQLFPVAGRPAIASGERKSDFWETVIE